MRKLTVFNHVSLDGYFSDEHGDMSWAHKTDPEWNAFASENAKGGGVLVFGRVTYELMTRYWPTPDALRNDPIAAERMNNLPKYVFSRTMDKASWNNTTVLKDDPIEAVLNLKQEPGADMVILGSGSIISRLAPAGLIDEYQVVVNPVVLGKGKTMFEGVKEKLALELTSARAFGNGNVLLCYKPAV